MENMDKKFFNGLLKRPTIDDPFYGIYRAMILVPPHGFLISSRKKTLVVKSRKFTTVTNKPLLLIQGKVALGIILLGDPKSIGIKKFNETKLKHCITDEERKRWWPKKRKFYSYDVTIQKIFTEPIPIEYTTGPQTFIRPEHIKK